MTTTVDLNEAQHLAQLVDLVRAGHEIIIAEGNTPVARLTAITPVAAPGQMRVAGLHQGDAWISDDFDAPLPDEFWLEKNETAARHSYLFVGSEHKILDLREGDER